MGSLTPIQLNNLQPDQSTGSQGNEEKITLTAELLLDFAVEACQKGNSDADAGELKESIHRFLKKCGYVTNKDHRIEIPPEESFLQENVESIFVCDTGDEGNTLLWWQIDPIIFVYRLDGDGGEDGEDADECADSISSYAEWMLPSTDFHGLWEALFYDNSIKKRLLHYAHTAVLFSDHGVDPQLISWNRIILLHGPPGTGKTSLCRALAQKLSIRFLHRYPQGGLLIEINTHSLFSKYFSESGKLVSRLFMKIREIVEEEDAVIFVLIDEVESLAAARRVDSSEPSDSIRAVNALLTQVDSLKRFSNVVVLATSNLTGSMDLAFIDRADIKAYIGPPSMEARYEILRSCMCELQRAGIISGSTEDMPLPWVDFSRHPDSSSVFQASPPLLASSDLKEAAISSEGLSGRALRKLPFLAHAMGFSLPHPCTYMSFSHALKSAIATELQERSLL